MFIFMKSPFRKHDFRTWHCNRDFLSLALNAFWKRALHVLFSAHPPLQLCFFPVWLCTCTSVHLWLNYVYLEYLIMALSSESYPYIYICIYIWILQYTSLHISFPKYDKWHSKEMGLQCQFQYQVHWIYLGK